MSVECELQPWARVANFNSLVVVTIDIAPWAKMETAITLLYSFAMAAVHHQVRVVVGDSGMALCASGACWKIKASALT